MDSKDVAIIIVGLGLTFGFLGFLAFLITQKQVMPTTAVRMTPEQYFGG